MFWRWTGSSSHGGHAQKRWEALLWERPGGQPSLQGEPQKDTILPLCQSVSGTHGEFLRWQTARSHPVTETKKKWIHMWLEIDNSNSKSKSQLSFYLISLACNNRARFNLSQSHPIFKKTGVLVHKVTFLYYIQVQGKHYNYIKLLTSVDQYN